MKIRDVMTTEIRTAELDTPIQEVAEMMRDDDIGSVPVVDEGEIAGILTDRDIVLRCIAEGLDPSDTTVEEVLTDEIVTVSPGDDVERALRIMSDRQIRRLPVVEDGELVGMVSIGDLAVKGDERRVGHTLEEVSEGVKATGTYGRQSEREQRGGSQRGAQQTGPRSVGVVRGGRQETIEQSGRHAGGTEGRSRIDIERGEQRRDINPSRAQGIANRNPREEQRRQKKTTASARSNRTPRRKAS